MKRRIWLLSALLLALSMVSVPVQGQRKGNPTKSKHYKMSHQARLKEAVAETPPVLQASLAEAFGVLYVYYDGRVCQVHTLAIDLIRTVYGADSYKGLSPEQFLSGYVFFYDQWSGEPVVLLEGRSTQVLMDARSNWVSLPDFYDKGEYRLERLLASGSKDAAKVDARVRMLEEVSRGELLRIWPPVGAETEWCSAAEEPDSAVLDAEALLFRSSVLDSIRGQLREGRNVRAHNMLNDIQLYQQSCCESGVLPSESRCDVERWLLMKDYVLPFWVSLLALGVLFGVPFGKQYRKNGRIVPWAVYVMEASMLIEWLSLSGIIGLIMYAYGRVPMGSFHEVLLCLAWAVLAAGIVYVPLHRRKNIRGIGGAIALAAAGVLTLLAWMV